MSRNIQHILALLVFLISPIGYAAAVPITDVRYLTHSDGLSNHRVFSIIEDQYGAVWIVS